jgi:predicted 2-oxoglutarate/Fe(II)-dependent dioxygenase YbiX
MTQLIDQYYHVPNVFTEAEIGEIIERGKAMAPSRAKVLKGGVSIPDVFARRCKQSWIQMRYDSRWIFNKLSDAVNHANDTSFKYNLSCMEPLHYLEYGFLGGYGKHVDNGEDRVRNRLLTAIVPLTSFSEYVGGGLVIHGDEYSMPVEFISNLGDVIVIDSGLPHEAKPVWWGNRKALVGWFRGPTPPDLKHETLLYDVPKRPKRGVSTWT